MVKNLPTMQETWVRSLGRVRSLDWVQSLGWEDPQEKEMATPSSIPAWRIPWTEEPGELQSIGSQTDTTEQLILNTEGCLASGKKSDLGTVFISLCP